MDEVEIECIDAEPAQTRLRRPQRPVTAQMGLPHLAGEKEPGAIHPSYRFADQLLGVTARIHFGGVDVNQSGVERTTDHGNVPGVVIARIPLRNAAQPPGALPQLRHRNAAGKGFPRNIHRFRSSSSSRFRRRRSRRKSFRFR